MKRPYVSIAILAILSFVLLSGCGITRTRREMYPLMYAKAPASVLILPPVNNSSNLEAKEYFACSLSEAVGRQGYYVFPVEAVFNVLRDEGLYETETLGPAVLANLRDYFGADAVLHTEIEYWEKVWLLTSGTLYIRARYHLISTQTGEVLWNFRSETEVKLESQSDKLVWAMVESAIKTAVEDYFPHARTNNIKTMKDALPAGKYHPRYMVDGDDKVLNSKTSQTEITK